MYAPSANVTILWQNIPIITSIQLLFVHLFRAENAIYTLIIQWQIKQPMAAQ